MSDEEAGKFMKQKVSVEYDMKPTPQQMRYAANMKRHKITGQRCPDCSRVYVPPRGYCPMCVVATGDEHEVEVAARGTVTSFTVVDPIQYQGQEEKDVYALASILLDGASLTIGQQRIGEIDANDVRTGMRVEAEWAGEDDAGDGGQNQMGNAIKHWGPNGEDDVPLEQLREHVL